MDKALNMDDINALVDTMYAYDKNLEHAGKSAFTSALSNEDDDDSDSVQLIPTYDESMTTLPKVMLYGSDSRQLASIKKLTQAKLRLEMNKEVEKAKRYFAGGISERSYTDYSGEFENYKRLQKEKAVSEIQQSKASKGTTEGNSTNKEEK